MPEQKPRIPEDLQRWIEARQRFHLSHTQVQMARELGLNPRKLGSLANHKQEPWKAPLPIFIENIYRKRFGKTQPDRVISIEDRAREIAAKKVAKRERPQAADGQSEKAAGKLDVVERVDDQGQAASSEVWRHPRSSIFDPR